MSAAETSPVRAVLDGYVAELATLDPDAAEALGRTDVLRVADLSPDAFAARADLDRRTLAALTAAPADGPDATLRLAALERLGSDVALDEVGFTRRLLAPLATPVHLVRQVFDGLPRSSEDDWRRVAAHLAEVPRALAQYRATLEQAADRGHVVAVRQVEVVAGQCDAWVAGGFYPGVAAGYGGADAALARTLAARADDAAAATAAFAADLRTRLAPRAGRADGVGRETYSVTSAAFLGTSVDLDDLYAWGWAEIARLQGRARDLARAVVGTPDVAAAVAALDADPARRVDVGAPLEAWLQGRLDAVTDAVDGRWFDLPARHRRVEARLTTAASGVMYYTPPDAGGTRPGRVWWTVPAGTQHVATWRDVSTVHHEGVPGHHLQHAVTYGLDLHPWQRLLCHVHGYAEGWAHYAEHLAEEIGLLDDPGERLGAVFAQLWRACRIVVDIGLHLDLPVPAGTGVRCLDGRDRWTPELGVQVLREVAEVDATTAAFEVDRYLGWPGQALAFKVGARLWQQVRADAQARTDRLDLRDFHMTALGLGPMGLGPLRTALATTLGARPDAPSRQDAPA
ncbi:DUF885 domain-containing protein [Cellulomonas shaoxiangyii]|uniref:DUF885 domain-containing protein n=1 Tax=Cellulomonas shaoxiangyii TaxID=2566013 RepID=A0A4P7SPD4_9CELL|nr:DUF885 domain-containing protein [Cellulomonas shaoxiangyii]TGY83439.1 DUF885 domain-containing protein [Cellulomonas shaoxiangyii]